MSLEPEIITRFRKVLEEITEDPGVRIRTVGVKPRRAGLSTFSLHCGYHEAMRREIEGITIADTKKNSQMLSERLGEFTTHDSYAWENPIVRNPPGHL